MLDDEFLLKFIYDSVKLYHVRKILVGIIKHHFICFSFKATLSLTVYTYFGWCVKYRAEGSQFVVAFDRILCYHRLPQLA